MKLAFSLLFAAAAYATPVAQVSNQTVPSLDSEVRIQPVPSPNEGVRKQPIPSIGMPNPWSIRQHFLVESDAAYKFPEPGFTIIEGDVAVPFKKTLAGKSDFDCMRACFNDKFCRWYTRSADGTCDNFSLPLESIKGKVRANKSAARGFTTGVKFPVIQ
jgi:hypothetical protein